MLQLGHDSFGFFCQNQNADHKFDKAQSSSICKKTQQDVKAQNSRARDNPAKLNAEVRRKTAKSPDEWMTLTLAQVILNDSTRMPGEATRLAAKLATHANSA